MWPVKKSHCFFRVADGALPESVTCPKVPPWRVEALAGAQGYSGRWEQYVSKGIEQGIHRDGQEQSKWGNWYVGSNPKQCLICIPGSGRR